MHCAFILKLCGWSHSIYFRTVSSQYLLPALLNWFKLVCGPCRQSEMHCTLELCPGQEGIECTKARFNNSTQVKVYILGQ